MTRLIATAEQSRQPELAIAFRLLAALGGRRGEVCGLQWRDVDVDTCVCVLRRAVKHVGPTLVVGDVTNHQERSVLLRHSPAAQLLTAGEAPVVVAEPLGHRDPSTTHRWHSQALPRSDRRAASLIGDALDR